MMDLKVSRILEYQGSTIGALLLSEPGGDKHLCYTLEPGFNKIKIPGETRIPAGKYILQLRKVGGFHQRYKNASWLPDGFHKGMLEVIDVPDFMYILQHVGNSKKDTKACTLWGMDFEKHENGFFLKSSRLAYKKVYPPIAAALEAGELVTIEYLDNDRLT